MLEDLSLDERLEVVKRLETVDPRILYYCMSWIGSQVSVAHPTREMPSITVCEAMEMYQKMKIGNLYNEEIVG